VREREEEGDVRDENSTKHGRSPPLPPSLTSLSSSFLLQEGRRGRGEEGRRGEGRKGGEGEGRKGGEGEGEGERSV